MELTTRNTREAQPRDKRVVDGSQCSSSLHNNLSPGGTVIPYIPTV